MSIEDNKLDSKIDALETLKLFRIIFKSANRHFHEVEKKAGIGGASLWALAEMLDINNLTMSELAKAMSIHQSTASNLIEKLEIKGYVVRIRSLEDRRVVHLTLTDHGREILSKAPPPYRGILPDALMSMDPLSLSALNGHLTDLIAGMSLKHDDSAFEPLGMV